MNDKPSPGIIDVTLRDGEQAPGVAFSFSDRLALAELLVEAGITEIEAGIPAMDLRAQQDFTYLADRLEEAGCPDSVRLIAWNRMKRSDIEASLRARARTVHLSLPVSDIMLDKKLGWTRNRAKDTAGALVEYCISEGLEVIVGAEDASRADPDFLDEVFRTAALAGAFRLRYADTLGLQDPFTVRGIMETLVPRYGAAMEYHAHNDLGLATANALSAISAGAWVSATVGGLGERAGNAALEQVAAAARLIHGIDTGLRLERSPALAELTAQMSARPIPVDRPLTGKAAFCHESGIHVDGLLKNPDLYQFIPPSFVGRESSIIPGRHSGRAAVLHCAKVLGRPINPDDADLVLERLKDRWKDGVTGEPWAVFTSVLAEGNIHAC